MMMKRKWEEWQGFLRLLELNRDSGSSGDGDVSNWTWATKGLLFAIEKLMGFGSYSSETVSEDGKVTSIEVGRIDLTGFLYLTYVWNHGLAHLVIGACLATTAHVLGLCPQHNQSLIEKRRFGDEK